MRKNGKIVQNNRSISTNPPLFNDEISKKSTKFTNAILEKSVEDINIRGKSNRSARSKLFNLALENKLEMIKAKIIDETIHMINELAMNLENDEIGISSVETITKPNLIDEGFIDELNVISNYLNSGDFTNAIIQMYGNVKENLDRRSGKTVELDLIVYGIVNQLNSVFEDLDTIQTNIRDVLKNQLGSMYRRILQDKVANTFGTSMTATFEFVALGNTKYRMILGFKINGQAAGTNGTAKVLVTLDPSSTGTLTQTLSEHIINFNTQVSGGVFQSSSSMAFKNLEVANSGTIVILMTASVTSGAFDPTSTLTTSYTIDEEFIISTKIT